VHVGKRETSHGEEGGGDERRRKREKGWIQKFAERGYKASSLLFNTGEFGENKIGRYRKDNVGEEDPRGWRGVIDAQ